MNILHISSDEKFIDMAMDIFDEVVPYKNSLIVISNINTASYVKYGNKIFLTKKELYKQSKDDFFWNDIDILILHSLFISKLYIPRKVKVIWIGFGFDYYDLICDYNKLLGDRTNYISVQCKSNSIKKMIKKYFLIDFFRKKKKESIISKIDYFCPVLETEYELINWNKKSKPAFLDWNYGTLEDNLSSLSINEINGSNILLGNSASETSNHLDMIDLLVKSNITQNLIIPLSYGDSSYSSIVTSYSKDNYQGSIEILTEFIEFEEYLKIISSCPFVIMGHKRQQGLGNIYMLLNIGAMIFLDKDNPIYSFLKNNNVHVFSLDEINIKIPNKKLTQDQINDNRIFLKNNMSRSVMINKTKKLIFSRKLR